MKKAVKGRAPVSMDALVQQTESPFTAEVLHFPLDRPKTRCVKCVPKCASVRVAPSNIVYYCTDIDPQGKVN